MSKVIRLAYLVSHPIQYQAPLLRRLASMPGIRLKTFFCSDFSVRQYRDEGFRCEVKWRVPLLNGYDSCFLAHSEQQGEESIPWINNFLIRALWKKEIDVLWLHGYTKPFYLWVMIVAKLKGVKILLRSETIDAYKDQRFLKRIVRPIFFAFVRRFVNAVLSIGSWNKQFFVRRGIQPKKIFFAPYAVDNQYFRERVLACRRERDVFRQSLGLMPGRPVILYASKLLTRKYPGDLLSAYQLLLSRLPEERQPYLLFAGDGEQRSVLELAAKDLEGVRFLGFKNQDELPAYFDLCDVFVLPSVRENWGLIVNEVMNAEKPIIVTDQVGCSVDLVRSGENGFVYPARDIEQLAEALYDVLSEPERAKRMGQQSLAIVSGWGLAETAAGVIRACEAVTEA